MERREFLQSTLFAFIGLRLQGKAGSSLSGADWKITMLTDDLGIFTESGGTILFHLSKSGITIVDAQFPASAMHLVEELKKKGMPFHLLINTHHHGDHTSGNIVFKPLISRVLGHVNSLKNQRSVAERQNSLDKQYLPTDTFTEAAVEKTGNETVRLNYFGAAHTDGDAVIHFEKGNIAHVGDLVFNRRHPFVDRSAGASIKSWINVLQKIRKHYNDNTLFVFGHAGDGYEVTGRKDDIAAFENYLSKVLEYVQNQINSGESLQDIIKKTTSIPGAPEWKGEGISRPLTAAYEELTAG
ncbi:MAG: MBL fold metallo-hydrolase [Chitinophagaceae bacterium]|nr:MBL fold metallo-hydrolase [Chitinophagaceae bacterium]